MDHAINTFKATPFRARGIKVDAAPTEFSRPQRGGRAPRSGFDLQNAYAAHLNRQARPAFGHGGESADELGSQTTTPFTRGVSTALANSKLSSVEERTGQTPNLYTRQEGDLDANGNYTAQGQRNADTFANLEKLQGARDRGEISDEEFNSAVNGLDKSQTQAINMQQRQQALQHALPHVPESARDLMTDIMGNPNITDNDAYDHLIRATAQEKPKKTSDPVDMYMHAARGLKEVQELVANDATGKLADDPRIQQMTQGFYDEMDKAHQAMSPNPAGSVQPSATPATKTPMAQAPGGQVTPIVSGGSSLTIGNPFGTNAISGLFTGKGGNHPTGGASTPPIPGMGVASETASGASNQIVPQYKMGQMLQIGGKQLQVVAIDPDGHPRVKEFVPQAQALPNTPVNPQAAQ